MTAVKYEQDFHAWALHNAALLRARRLAEADIEHIAEELESMGASERRELIHRLAVLVAHLLKWQYQPGRRSNSWKATINAQRIEVAIVLKQNLSLNSRLDEFLTDAYRLACLRAVKEAGFSEDIFPVLWPFTVGEALSDEFWTD